MPEHATVQGIARSGKSWSMIDRAVDIHDGEKIVYLAPTHEEAKATMKKWREQNVEPGYLIGEERARREYDISTSGQINPGFSPSNPNEAARRDDVNAYNGLIRGVNEKDVIVTVPELLNKIEGYDWLMMTEEAAFNRILAEPHSILDVKRTFGYDRTLNTSITKYENRCQAVLDDIGELDQKDECHRAIEEAARCVVDVCNIVKDWKPGSWNQVEDEWDALVATVERRLEHMKDVAKPSFDKLFTRLQNYNRIDSTILNTLYYDGTLQYGQESDNRKQLFYTGDPDRVYFPIADDTTLWLAGNSVPAMNHFHEIVHGDPPDPIGFKNGYKPIRDALDDNVVIRYTGRDNENQQAKDVQRTIEQIQKLRDNTSSLIISGSSKYCSQHAERIKRCITPSEQDDIKDVRQYGRDGMAVAIPENSEFSEGVDTPQFDMGAIYNGRFAAPLEEYVKRETGDRTLLEAERIRAAQNAILRPSNIPDGRGSVKGTGKTPIIVPDRHVPEEIFELFEEYGIHVVEAKNRAEMRRMIIDALDNDAVIDDSKIVTEDEAEPDLQSFDELFEEDELKA